MLLLKNLLDWSQRYVHSKHKRAKGGNKNVVATITHGAYKVVLLDKKCLRHPTNRMRSKNHRIVTYDKIKNISLSYFNDKMYILNNGCDG